MILDNSCQGLFFDLDGTLADTVGQLSLAARTAAAQLNLPPCTDQMVRGFVGNGINMLLARIISGRFEVKIEQVDADLLKHYRQAFNRCYEQGLKDNFSIYPYVEQTLALLKQRGIKAAVITNKPYVFAKPLLGFMGLESYFDLIIGGEMGYERKPDPQSLLVAVDKLELDIKQCFMVGDSDNDILAGHNARLGTIFIRGGYYNGQPEELHCDYIFDNFKALYTYLEGI